MSKGFERLTRFTQEHRHLALDVGCLQIVDPHCRCPWDPQALATGDDLAVLRHDSTQQFVNTGIVFQSVQALTPGGQDDQTDEHTTAQAVDVGESQIGHYPHSVGAAYQATGQPHAFYAQACLTQQTEKTNSFRLLESIGEDDECTLFWIKFWTIVFVKQDS
jgi:hypothetical protein